MSWDRNLNRTINKIAYLLVFKEEVLLKRGYMRRESI